MAVLSGTSQFAVGDQPSGCRKKTPMRAMYPICGPFLAARRAVCSKHPRGKVRHQPTIVVQHGRRRAWRWRSAGRYAGGVCAPKGMVAVGASLPVAVFARSFNGHRPNIQHQGGWRRGGRLAAARMPRRGGIATWVNVQHLGPVVGFVEVAGDEVVSNSPRKRRMRSRRAEDQSRSWSICHPRLEHAEYIEPQRAIAA